MCVKYSNKNFPRNKHLWVFWFCFFKGTVLPWFLISSILYEVSLQRWPPRQHLPLGPESLGDHQDTLQDPFPESPFIVIELTLWGYFDFFLMNTQDEPVEVQSPFFAHVPHFIVWGLTHLLGILFMLRASSVLGKAKFTGRFHSFLQITYDSLRWAWFQPRFLGHLLLPTI